MKKFWSVILTIILAIILVSITLSYSAENIVINTLSSELTYKKVSSKILDFVIKYDLDKIDDVDNIIKNSNQISKITKKFLNATIENVSYNKNSKVDISSEINNLVNDELSKYIDEETRNSILLSFSNYGDELENEFEVYLTGFSYDYAELFKIYYMLVNTTFRICILIILCIDIIILILLLKLNVFKNLKIGSIVTGIITIVFLLLVRLLRNYIDQNFSGGRLNNINTSSLLIFTIVWILLSIIFIVLDKRIQNRVEK